MITHEIRKPQKIGIMARVFGGQRIHHPQNDRPPWLPNNAVAAITDLDRKEAAKYLDKAFYNTWITQQGRLYQKGDLVTLTLFPIVLSRTVPVPFYYVDLLQEIRHLAQWDSVHKEPRAVGLRPGDNNGVYTFVAPKGIRRLTKGELDLVYTHHPEIEAAHRAKAEPANDNYTG